MKYFSMFSGIGGFELGIQRASYKQPAEIEQDGQGRNWAADKVGHDVLPTGWATPLCVGYSEIDKYAISTYEQHFEGHTNYGDATNINAAELPDFDLLVGGFPCQAFSIAGKRAGFNDTRGTLFFDIARILKEKQPRHLVLENVKGLLSHDGGRTFTTILGVLADLGYLVEWQVLNSKDFGVPQNRERVFIVGHLGGDCEREVFPLAGNYREAVQVHPTIDANYYKGYSNQRRMIQQVGNIHEHKRNRPNPNTGRIYGIDGVSPTLSTMQGGGLEPKVLKDTRIRRLTPTECERLQGFPDDWTIGSDTQRYKQCGNAVTVNVVEAVMKGLGDCL